MLVEILICLVRRREYSLDRVSCKHTLFIHPVQARLIRATGSKLILTFLCKFDDVFNTSQSNTSCVQHRHPVCRFGSFADHVRFFDGKGVDLGPLAHGVPEILTHLHSDHRSDVAQWI